MWFGVCYSFIIVDAFGELFALDHCQGETVSLLKDTSCLTGSQREGSAPTLPVLDASQRSTEYPPCISVSTALSTDNAKNGHLCTLLYLIATQVGVLSTPDSTENLNIGHGCFLCSYRIQLDHIFQSALANSLQRSDCLYSTSSKTLSNLRAPD